MLCIYFKLYVRLKKLGFQQINIIIIDINLIRKQDFASLKHLASRKTISTTQG